MMIELPPISPHINININHAKNEEELLIQDAAANKQRIIRNNLYLITILNFFTFLTFIFTMSYYKWLKIQFQIQKKQTAQVWVNLLYAYDSKYLTFSKYSTLICQTADGVCSSVLQQLSFVGSFCFLIFFVAHALQLIDIFVFVWRICKKHPLTASNFFRQVFIICTFIYGILIYLFSIAVIKNVGKSVYGVCIYFNMVSVVILIGVVVYQQISIRKMMKAELVLQLLEGQKQFQGRQTDRYAVNRQSDSFVL